MSDISWIKLKTEMFSDERIRLIESMPEADTILIIWIKLLIQAGKTNANGYIFLNENVPFTPEMLATLFDRPLTVVRLALNTLVEFGMISIDETGKILIENWTKHQNIEGMEKVREQTRKRVAKFRENQKLLNNKNKDLDKDIEKNVTRNVTHSIQKVVKEKYPNIAKLKKQLSFEECEKLKNNFTNIQIKEIFNAMENYKPLAKKNISVYLTFTNWARRQNKNNNNGKTNSSYTPLSQRKN